MVNNITTHDRSPRVFLVRGVHVVLDEDLAAALGLETKRLNEAIKRNADLIDDRHRFQLTPEEFAALRSQSATSNPGRGGRTYRPWVFTERGVTRVTTFINTPQAIRASDLIVDTFIAVQRQIAAGQTAINIENPSRYHLDTEAAQFSKELGRKLMKALNGLLDTVIDIRTGDTVGGTAMDMTSRALEHLREKLRKEGLENLKLEAEIQLLLQEAANAAQDVEGKKLQNLEKRIDLVQKLMHMHRDMEPVQVIGLLDRLDTAEPVRIDQRSALPTPRTDDDEAAGE